MRLLALRSMFEGENKPCQCIQKPAAESPKQGLHQCFAITTGWQQADNQFIKDKYKGLEHEKSPFQSRQ